MSAITELLNCFSSLWIYLSMKNNHFFLQEGSFAEDKEFFPCLPTIPILENSTKMVQTKGPSFSIAVTPENSH